MIDEKHTVEMIHFVLHNASEHTMKSTPFSGADGIGERHDDHGRALHATVEIANTETAFPTFFPPISFVNKWIDEQERIEKWRVGIARAWL